MDLSHEQKAMLSSQRHNSKLGRAPHLDGMPCGRHEHQLELALHLSYRERLVQPALNTQHQHRAHRIAALLWYQAAIVKPRHMTDSTCSCNCPSSPSSNPSRPTHPVCLTTIPQSTICQFALNSQWPAACLGSVLHRDEAVLSQSNTPHQHPAQAATQRTCLFLPAAASWAPTGPGRHLTAPHTSHASRGCWQPSWCATARSHQHPAAQSSHANMHPDQSDTTNAYASHGVKRRHISCQSA